MIQVQHSYLIPPKFLTPPSIMTQRLVSPHLLLLLPGTLVYVLFIANWRQVLSIAHRKRRARLEGGCGKAEGMLPVLCFFREPSVH